MINRLAIIGVGLIGSSLALALKQASAVKHVVGCGRNQENLQKGVELGVIDSYQTDIGDAVKGADIIVLAVPLGAMRTVFEQISGAISDRAVITDVGSAKASVVKVASECLGDRVSQYVPGHPIAGTEKSGVEAGIHLAEELLRPLEKLSGALEFSRLCVGLSQLSRCLRGQEHVLALLGQLVGFGQRFGRQGQFAPGSLDHTEELEPVRPPEGVASLFGDCQGAGDVNLGVDHCSSLM